VAGLFSQVMTQGGSALGLWAIDETVGVGASESVAAEAGCDQTTAQQIAACMRSKTPEVIVNAYLRYAVSSSHTFLSACLFYQKLIKLEYFRASCSYLSRDIFSTNSFIPSNGLHFCFLRL